MIDKSYLNKGKVTKNKIICNLVTFPFVISKYPVL